MKKWLVIGLVIVGAIYVYRHPEVWSLVEEMGATVTQTQEKTTYRWRNDKGVVQYTDKPPPKGIDYELVEADPDANMLFEDE